MRSACLSVVVWLFLATVPMSGEAQCGAKVGEWPYGPSYAAAGNGEIAVYGAGRVLQVADVSDLDHPRVVGSVPLAHVIRDVVIQDSVVFVAADQAGLVVVDVAQRDRPRVIGTWQGRYAVWAVEIVGDLGFVAASGDNLVILDLSAPSAPVEVGRLESDETIYDVAVHGDVAYLAASRDGVLVADVSDPAAPTPITLVEGFDRTGRLDVSGDGQVLAVTDQYEGLLKLFDLSDPRTPNPLATIDFSDYALDVALREDRAYLANRTYGMRIYDISDPTVPEEVYQVAYQGQTEGLSLHGDVVYLANHRGGLGLAELVSPDDVVFRGFILATSDLKHADMDGGLLVAGAGGQFLTVDISDPSAPVTLAAIETPGYADAAIVHGEHAFVADNYRGLTVVDVSRPSAPEIVTSLEVCEARHLVRSGTTLYLACYDEGIAVVDVSSPAAPVALGSLDGFTARTAAYADGVVYLTDYGTGVHVVDVTDPTAPEYVTTIDVEDANSHPPTVNGDRLFVIVRTGVVIFDISTPTAPVEIGRVEPTTYMFGTAPVGDLLFIASIYSDAFIYDVSDPSAAVELTEVETAVVREGEVAWEGSLVLVGQDDAGFEIFDLSACFDQAPVASFTWRPGTPEAGSSVHFTDASYGSISSWSWDFGDGRTSTERFPDHVFTEAGDYEVTLTVDGAFGAALHSETVTVAPRSGGGPPITDPGEHVSVIAAAAHAPGLEGTQWVTDAVLHNPGVMNAQAHVWFLEADRNNSDAESVAIPVAAGTSVALDDLIGTRFGRSDASGAVLIGSDQPLIVTSRTYNDAETGTYGQFIPGIGLEDAVLDGESAWLIQLTRTPGFRTNLGIANPTPDPLEVRVSVLEADGTEIAVHTITVPPFGYRQRTDIVGADAVDAVAVVTSETPGATYLPYASVVDNRTGDPIYVAPIWPDAVQVIAAAAHVQGLEDTDWRTDLELCSTAQDDIQVTMRLLESRQDNTNPRAREFKVAGGACSRLVDTLHSEFGFDGTAALEITTRQDDLLVSSRTYNTTVVGTYGQFLPGIPSWAVLASGNQARITQLHQSVNDGVGYRTNLGFVNATGEAITVEVDLYAANGALLGSLEVGLKPFEHRQINRVFREVTGQAVANGTVAVATSTPGGFFVAYASVVDNVSGDPVYVPAVPVAR